jgi:uncharacterized C2H2 Zn-finger protein
MGIEITRDYEVVLKCMRTGEIRRIRRTLIEKHITQLEHKLNEGTIENDYKILDMYRVIESGEL